MPELSNGHPSCPPDRGTGQWNGSTLNWHPSSPSFAASRRRSCSWPLGCSCRCGLTAEQIYCTWHESWYYCTSLPLCILYIIYIYIISLILTARNRGDDKRGNKKWEDWRVSALSYAKIRDQLSIQKYTTVGKEMHTLQSWTCISHV